MCLHASFVPPQRRIAAVPEAVTDSSEHFLPSLLLNRSHQTNHLALEGGDRLVNRHGPMILPRNHFGYAHFRHNRL
jgi:hypothetical protein